MTEPSISNVTGAALLAWVAAQIGPVLGGHLLIFIFAFFGALARVARSKRTSKREAAGLVLLAVLLAVTATGLIARAIGAATGTQATDYVALAALFIGYQTDWVVQRIKQKAGDKPNSGDTDGP